MSAARPRVVRVPSDPAPLFDALAAQIETGFRAAVAQAMREAHSAGIPVAMPDEAGQHGWLHSDGTIHPANASTEPA